jgi:nucleoside-diphosphate-sugar epimerase
MKSTKVLVTGAGGFLGSYITRDLIKKGYLVSSFSRKKYSFLNELGVNQYIGDLANYNEIENAVIGVDAVIHTASMVGMWGRYADFFAANVTGTENLIKAMKKHNVSKLIYTSTPSVAFERESLCGVDESTPYPTQYLTHYATTKSIAEKIVLAANDNINNQLLTMAIRPHLIFGPGDLNLIPRVLEAQRKKRLKIIGDGENLVDVTYVENAADAHIMALEQLSIGHPIAGKAYFLGQGPVKLWDFTNDLLKHAGLPPVTKKISFKKAYLIGFLIESFLKVFRINNIHPPMTRFIALQLAKSHYFNHQNLSQDLGFNPKVSIEEGIERYFRSLR